MKTYKKNGARALRMAKLKQNPKQLLNNQAQEHNFLGKETTMKEQMQNLNKNEDGAPRNGHVIASKVTPEEEEEKVNKRYATSIINTITNCGIFIAHVTTFGAKYATNVALYQLANLILMESDANRLVKGVDMAEGTYKYAVAARQDEFAGYEALCALILAEVQLGGASEVTIAQLRTLMRLLRGERKVAKNPNTPMANYKSVSQLNYDDIVANFARLLVLVGEDPNYDPVTESIKMLTLETKLEALRTVNTNAQVAEAELDAARMARNEFFDAPVIGLCDVFNNAKKVVLINFGRKSEQYKKVRGLTFRKIGR